MKNENITKQEYESPRLEIVQFAAEDVITASNPGIVLPDDEFINN